MMKEYIVKGPFTADKKYTTGDTVELDEDYAKKFMTEFPDAIAPKEKTEKKKDEKE
jgi:hypothetical protein